MRKLDTTAISPAAQMFIKRGTLDFLQQADQEVFNAVILSLIGVIYDPTQIYVLYGCVNTGIPPAVNISAGAVFYNGEVYLVPATNFFLGGGQVAIATGQLSFYNVNADPVTFTDNSQHSVHQIRTMSIVAGASGAGLGLAGEHLPDFGAFIPANPRVSLDGNIVTGAWPTFHVNQVNKTLMVAKFDLPGDVGASGTILSGGVASLYNILFPDLGTNNYIVTGQLRSKSGTSGGQVSDAACTALVTAYASNGFNLIVKKKDNAAGVADLAFDFEIKSLA